MKYITSKTLVLLDACYSQRDLFAATFGSRAAITPANVEKAINAGLDVEWLVGRLAIANHSYDDDYHVYRQACIAANEFYAEAIKPALAQRRLDQTAEYQQWYDDDEPGNCDRHDERKRLIEEKYQEAVKPFRAERTKMEMKAYYDFLMASI